MMKSEIDTVIDDMAIKRMILFSSVKLVEEFTDMVSKNPNKKPANVVNSALSLIMEP
jgi:hypothetical protein